MKSNEMNEIIKASWIISNLINTGSVDFVQSMIQTEHVVEYSIEVLNKLDDLMIVNQVITALARCIDVDSGLKEVYLRSNLKSILESRFITFSNECKLLMSKFMENYEEYEGNGMNLLKEKQCNMYEDDCEEEEYDEYYTYKEFVEKDDKSDYNLSSDEEDNEYNDKRKRINQEVEVYDIDDDEDEEIIDVEDDDDDDEYSLFFKQTNH